jgi:hypothetical protein
MQCLQIKMAHDAYSQTPRYKGPFNAMKLIVQEEGKGFSLFMGSLYDSSGSVMSALIAA